MRIDINNFFLNWFSPFYKFQFEISANYPCALTDNEISMEGSSDDKIDWYISKKKREYNRENFLILIEIKIYIHIKLLWHKVKWHLMYDKYF